MTTKILIGDCLDVLKTMPDESVQCCITSPPYWGLRSYIQDYKKLKKDTPDEVIAELENLGVFPVDRIGE
jgi:DNA modification methylase